MKPGTILRLKPKSARGKRKLKSGLGEVVRLVSGPTSVQCFHGELGLLVAPMNPPENLTKVAKAFDVHDRWIRLCNDPDFEWSAVEPEGSDFW